MQTYKIRTCSATADAIPTIGGNADGAACVLPFTYKGVEYDSCTLANDHKHRWCSINPVYEVGRQWGYCDMCEFCSLTLFLAYTKVALFMLV